MGIYTFIHTQVQVHVYVYVTQAHTKERNKSIT